MLKTPELAMPRSRKVTTVCNGNREFWTDYEEAKAHFLEIMMTAEGDSSVDLLLRFELLELLVPFCSNQSLQSLRHNHTILVVH